MKKLNLKIVIFLCLQVSTRYVISQYKYKNVCIIIYVHMTLEVKKKKRFNNNFTNKKYHNLQIINKLFLKPKVYIISHSLYFVSNSHNRIEGKMKKMIFPCNQYGYT